MTAMTDEALFGATTDAPEVDDLADLLAEMGERAPRFTVTDEASAAWVVDKLVGCDERAARLTAQYESMLTEIKRDKARLERRFLPELEAYFNNTPRKGKSIKLLTGTLAKRTVPGKPARLGVVDPAQALTWAQVNFPGAVIQVPTLEPETLIDHVRETGEAVPGVELLPGRPDYESFTVKGPKS